ncbi:tripartite tricarboxylate transporter TctB family protein [Oribacterium sp. WCC10]|uniref:tripartite tricarboxylate transporter TctB family protein n=1 Tax=Oribacterium sp. WCC10 TaxID=1855343 RepID=UPI0008F368F6|nr:tripartite tricarboxylate transporter TctB family protein [Oribacterium sp. WCC10]SFG77396.1 Tripartite tricarboxylate transporter TctB family protein [Oribacterium sp. WCC10]
MKVTRDQITGAVIVALGIFVFVMISSFKVPFKASYPGPKALPGLAAIGFVICGAGIFLEGCRNKVEKTFLVKEGWIKLIVNIVAIAAYILVMKYLGFFIATPVYLYALSTWYAKGYETKPVTRIIFSLGMTAVIFLAYQIAFGYQLPMGIFG